MKLFQNDKRFTRVHHNAQSNMKPKQHLTAPLGILALLLTCTLAAPAAHGAAATSHPPERMTYQGYLVDANGVPLGNTAPINTSVIFRIWKVATGSVAANRMWTEQQTVTIDKGYFSVVLGDGNVYAPGGVAEAHGDLSAVFSGSDASDRFLGLTIPDIMGANELLPRITLVPSPYAFLARYANGIADDANGEFALTNTTSALRITKTIQTLGGNARGTQAVDLQDNRSSNTQVASGNYSVVSGGRRNTASGADSVVGGGYQNTASDIYSVVGGGRQNTASADYSVVPGGYLNVASGNYSFAAGRRAKANHSGAFVWADGANSDWASTANNQFLIKASGGVGININNATTMSGNALTVGGDLQVTGAIKGAFDPDGIATDAITSAKIKDGEVKTADILDETITSADIKDETITSSDIDDETITANDLGANSVDSSELVNGSIDPGHIGSGAFSFDRIEGRAVGASGSFFLYDKNSVLTAAMDSNGRFGYRTSGATDTSFHIRGKAADNTIFRVSDSNGNERFKVSSTGNATFSGTINNSAIANNAINSARIANGSITSEDIGNGTITTDDIKNSTITGTDIANDTIGVGKFTGGAGTLKSNGNRLGVNHAWGNVSFNVRGVTGDDSYFQVEDPTGVDKIEIRSNGNFYVNGSAVHTSDRSLKKNIAPLSSLLPRVLQLKASEYHYKTDDDTKPRRVGFIAQEIQEVFPNIVDNDGDHLALDYNAFGVIAIKAIQEQQALIEDKDERIAALETRLSEQETANSARDTRLSKLEQRLEQLLAAAEAVKAPVKEAATR